MYRALGDAWSDYLTTGLGPAGGQIVTPNGDTLVFDGDGLPNYTIPRAEGWGDDTTIKDPSSPFFGWTVREKAQYDARQGVTSIVTDELRRQDLTAAEIAASDARLRSESTQRVTDALLKSATGAHDSVAAETAKSEAANEQILWNSARAQLNDLIARGYPFTDTLTPGQSYPEYLLRGMISTQQWIEDYISVVKGGRPLHALAAAGQLPALPAGVTLEQHVPPVAIVPPPVSVTPMVTEAPVLRLSPPSTTSSAIMTDDAAPADAIVGTLRAVAQNPMTWVALGVLLLSRKR